MVAVGDAGAGNEPYGNEAHRTMPSVKRSMWVVVGAGRHHLELAGLDADRGLGFDDEAGHALLRSRRATDAQAKGQLQPHDDGQVADETLSTVAKAGVTIAV